MTDKATSVMSNNILLCLHREDHLKDMVRVTVGMEAIWQEQDLVVDEEQGKAELQSAIEDARRTGEDVDEEKLAAQVYEAVKVRFLPLYIFRQGLAQRSLPGCREECRLACNFADISRGCSSQTSQHRACKLPSTHSSALLYDAGIQNYCMAD